jgi:uncharacterized membrane protein YtjA (UPF0391 family)
VSRVQSGISPDWPGANAVPAAQFRAERLASAAVGRPMLYLAFVFLVIAVIAGALGFRGASAAAATVAKLLFGLFLLLFLIFLLIGLGIIHAFG